MAPKKQAIGLALWPYLYDKNQWCLSSVKDYVQGPGVSVQGSSTSVQSPRYLTAPCTPIFCRPLNFNHIDFITVQGPPLFWGPCTLWTWFRSGLPVSCFHIAQQVHFLLGRCRNLIDFPADRHSLQYEAIVSANPRKWRGLRSGGRKA